MVCRVRGVGKRGKAREEWEGRERAPEGRTGREGRWIASSSFFAFPSFLRPTPLPLLSSPTRYRAAALSFSAPSPQLAYPTLPRPPIPQRPSFELVRPPPIRKLTSPLSSFPSLSRCSKNRDTPLDCWREAEDFKAAVAKLEQVSLSFSFFRRPTGEGESERGSEGEETFSPQ